MTDCRWETLLSLASVLASTGVMLGIWWQLKCANTQRRFEALSVLHAKLYGPSMIEALRFIYSKSADELTAPSTEDELAKIEYVVNAFDLVGVKIAKGVLPRKDTLATEWRVLLRLSAKLSGFLAREREIRDGWPYKEHLLDLMSAAEAYRNKNFPEYKVTFFSREFGDKRSPTPVGLTAQHCVWQPSETERS